MRSRFLIRSLLFIVLGSNLCTTHAKEITLTYKSLTLNANLEIATNNKPVDDVILITHGTLAHRGMEIITYLQSLFKQRGYNTLAINLSLGLDNRHDMYDCQTTHRHRYTDAIEEIDAWINWLKGQGVKQITLLGHSRGGSQAALYAAEKDNPMLKAAVLLAPAIAENNSAASYSERYNKSLREILDKSQRLADSGNGDIVMPHIDFLFCPDTAVTANSFNSYYAPDPRLDTPYLIPKIRKPVMIVVAGDDEIVVGLDKKIQPLVDNKRVHMKVIENADHFFRDLYADDTVDVIEEFLKSISK